MEILGLDRFAKVGNIGKAHALSGQLKLSFDHACKADALSKLNHLFVDCVSPPIPFFIESIKQAPQPDFYLVQFESVKTKEEAKTLTDSNLYLLQEEVDRYFNTEEDMNPPASNMIDLVGFTITDKNLGTIGVIEDVTEMPQQFLATVSYQEREVMVPLNDHLIEQIHQDQQVIYVNLPEGLLDVYLGE